MNSGKAAIWVGLLAVAFAGVALAADPDLRVMDIREQFDMVFSRSTMDKALDHLKTLPYLSYWLLVVSFMSLFGTLQAFYSTALLKQFQFNLKQQEVTPLAGRLFGCWTTLATLLRVACALEPENLTVYRLTICTFILAMSLFIHAVVIARAMSFRNAMMPMVFALPSFIWMVFFPPRGHF